MEKTKKTTTFILNVAIAVYVGIVLVLIVLSISNYPVQWRDQVNKERRRYLEVFAQALNYYKLDHDGTVFALPSEPAIISTTSTCSFACPSLGTTLTCYNLAQSLVPDYMKKILQDPLLDSEYNSGFYIAHTAGTVRLGACNNFFKSAIELTEQL